jgi:hypothetical protein
MRCQSTTTAIAAGSTGTAVTAPATATGGRQAIGMPPARGTRATTTASAASAPITASLATAGLDINTQAVPSDSTEFTDLDPGHHQKTAIPTGCAFPTG